MRGKYEKGQADEEFVRAADEVVRHIGVEHACVAVARLGASEQRTVLAIRVTAMSTATDSLGAQVAAVEGHFPNSRAATLAAYVFALLTSLDHMLDSIAEAQHKTA